MNQIAQNALGGLSQGLGGFAGEEWEKDHLRKQAAHHRARAFEIAKDLPDDPARAKAVLDDALRLHAVIHDASASAVTHDLHRLLGE